MYIGLYYKISKRITTCLHPTNLGEKDLDILLINVSKHLTVTSTWSRYYYAIGHVNNIPTMQFFTGISQNTQSKSYMLSLTGCAWDFQNNVLWDTH